MSLYTALPVLAALFFLGYLVQMLRARRIREKYVTLWLALGAVVLVLSIFPRIAFRVADVLGFQAPSNMLLAAAVLVLLLVSVHLSSELSSVEEQRRTIAEEIALTRLELDELRAAVTGASSAGDAAPGGAARDDIAPGGAAARDETPHPDRRDDRPAAHPAPEERS